MALDYLRVYELLVAKTCEEPEAEATGVASWPSLGLAASA
jgi:hypothetical protein